MYYIGVDVGGTGIKAGVVTEEGKILKSCAIATNQKSHYTELMKDMADLIFKTLNEAKISIDDIKSIGIGFPGSVDDKNGVVVYTANINLNNAPVVEELKKYINKPVYIGNDANCAALGEYFALNDDSIENFVAVTLGTGVGGGIIINKKLYTGSNDSAGEIGHIRLMMNGEKCSCGREGCWECYASATALIRDSKRAAINNPDSLLAKNIEENGGRSNGKLVFDTAKKGDKTAKEVIDNYIRYISEGIIDMINIFQPSVIAIGGGISRQGDNLLNPIKEYIKGKPYGDSFITPCKITVAKLGNDAGIVGAAFLGK
ncbi:MAG: ROK family protein [Clostridia bacterium]|nr:ROK family protein [Clostridia bacterium]